MKCQKCKSSRYLCFLFLFFSHFRHSSTAERAASMSRYTCRITNLAHTGTTRVLSKAWRGRARLQQKSREVGEKSPIKAQGAEAKVSVALIPISLPIKISLYTETKLCFLCLRRNKKKKQFINQPRCRREQWPMFSSYACWQQLIQQTKSLARDHATLADIYSNQLVQRLQTVYDDCQRIYKRCREVGYEIHEEILRVLQELHQTMKTFHGYQLECREAEKKLRAAEVQRTKIQQSIPKEKLERNKKFKVIEKEVMKVRKTARIIQSNWVVNFQCFFFFYFVTK